MNTTFSNPYREKTVSEFETRPEDRSLKTVFRLLSALELEFDVAVRPSDPGAVDPDQW